MVPRWLSWLFVLFLGYIIVTGNRGMLTQEAAPEKAARQEQVAEYYPAIHALVDGDRWKRAINPAYTEEKPCAPMHARDNHLTAYAILEERGAGDGVECGQPLHFRATLWDAAGKKQRVLTNHTITLGEQPGLDALVVGMAINETRTLILPVPAEGYNALPELKKGGVNMLTLTRESPKDSSAKPAEE